MAKRRIVFTESLRELGLLIFIVLISVAVQLRNPAFLTLRNINALLTNTSILGIMAVGMMLVLVTRGIDLSVGSIVAFTGMVTALTVVQFPGLPPLVAIIQGMVIGAGIGTLTGILVARFDVP